MEGSGREDRRSKEKEYRIFHRKYYEILRSVKASKSVGSSNKNGLITKPYFTRENAQMHSA